MAKTQNIFLKMLGIKSNPRPTKQNGRTGVFQKQFPFPTKTISFKVHEKVPSLIGGADIKDFLFIFYQRIWKELSPSKKAKFENWELLLIDMILNTPWNSNEPLTSEKANAIIHYLHWRSEHPNIDPELEDAEYTKYLAENPILPEVH